MRIVRSRFEQERLPQLDEVRGPWLFVDRPGSLTGSSSFEARILFNRFETRVILAGIWVREAWFNEVTWRVGRALCRLLGRHNVTCRGRRDHGDRSSLDPACYGWPRH